MRWSQWRFLGGALLLGALLLSAGRPGAAAPVLITPGVGIGPLTIGMRAADVPRVLKKAATPKLSGDQVVYDFSALGFTVWAADDRVVKIRTKNGLHKTRSGVHPGQIWADGVLAMCAGMALTTAIPGGVEYSCPFVGISFEVKGRELAAISVTKAKSRV